MYNAHSYAHSIEVILKLPSHSADKIEKDPLGYLKSFLDAIYEKSEKKARLIDTFDDKYKKYEGQHFINWAEEDAAQMVKDLRAIVS